MANGPYSRIYHALADEYPEIWQSDVRLGRFIRLLIQAEKWYPQWVPTPARRDRVFQILVDSGLILIRDGSARASVYTVRGLQAERGRRSQHASHAASSRWASGQHAEPMLRQDETRQDETRSARERAVDETNGSPKPATFMGYKQREPKPGSHEGQHGPECMVCHPPTSEPKGATP